MNDLERVERLLKRKQLKKAKLIDAYLDEVFDKETVQLRKSQLDEEINSALLEKANLESQFEEIINLPKKVKDIEQLRQKVDTAFAKMTLARKREVLEL